MRTVSQMFADALRSGNVQGAQQCLAQYGTENTKGAFWLAMESNLDPSWKDKIQLTTFSPADAEQAALLFLARELDNDTQRCVFAHLLSHVSDQWFHTRHPFHHASYHGNQAAFDLLEDEYKTRHGVDFDWNTSDRDSNTPLYYALSQTHLDTTAAILMKGGSPTHPSTHLNKDTTILSKVFAQKHGMLNFIKQIWHSASDKAAIHQALGPNQLPKKGKKKKM